MELKELNSYLEVLTGTALIEYWDLKNEILKIQVTGDVGTFDKGEIDLIFHGVEVVNLPNSILTPIQLTKSTKDLWSVGIKENYQEQGKTLFEIIDDAEDPWFIYAESFSFKKLPIYYG